MTTNQHEVAPNIGSAPRSSLPVIIALVLLVLSTAVGLAFSPDAWQVVLLGVVQGFTEFLPISSTGHLLIASKLLGFEHSIGGTFEIFIQLGTVVSVLVFYSTDLLRQARALLGGGDGLEVRAARRLWLAVLIAFVPAAVIGVLFRSAIKLYLFDSPATIAISLIIGGIIFIVLERVTLRTTQTDQLGQISPKQALGVGIAQVFALVPGTSRSGSSIVGGLLSGIDRRNATAFSFYLAIPTLGAATLVDLLGAVSDGLIGTADIWRLLLGAVVAGIVGYLSIGWLLRFVARNSFVPFGIYRILAGAVILMLMFAGWL